MVRRRRKKKYIYRYRKYVSYSMDPGALLAFVIGILLGLSQNELFTAFKGFETFIDLAKSFLAVFGVITLISFALRILYYPERGYITRTIYYTGEWLITNTINSLVDGISASIGYILGATIASTLNMIKP